MGTRARINIFDGNTILVSIHNSFDGYPTGLGAEIAKFANMTIVNGIVGDGLGTANGMGCFAAQLIKKLKQRVGSVYIRDTGPKSHGEEFVYNLHDRGGHLWIDVLEGQMTAFGNPGDEEAEMKAIYSGPLFAYTPE